ncbi:putative pectinesterase/pectinesterase inhibitor 12 [Bidens hawaiensis]|uniref:putative pectinesterase/pectinesterase inhibitor 12 n=1 Tax=Bidens hawaiensis TaxID=980011 RepID=UPI004049AF06
MQSRLLYPCMLLFFCIPRVTLYSDFVNPFIHMHKQLTLIMSFSKHMIHTLILILILMLILMPTNRALPSKSLATSVCQSTPYPDACLKISVSIDINNINVDNILLQSLKAAISEALKVLSLLDINITEKHKGTIQDCNELHQITLASLNKSLTRLTNPKMLKLADVNAFLTAAVTNKNTCLEGLQSASGPQKPLLVASIIASYQHVSNCLSLLSAISCSTDIMITNDDKGMTWLSKRDHKIFHNQDDNDNDNDYDYDYDYNNYDANTLTVALDGSGNFTSITDAINFAPNNSVERVIIYIKEGSYEENVDIPSYKTNMVLLGDGSDTTIITGNRSVVDGWTTFKSATIAVSGEGFLARDIGFHNLAGAEKHQAVALRVNADLAAVYRCTISSYQDTLYVHSFRQFYRECDIYGTIDYVFGNAAAVFQGCNLISRMPMLGQFTVISAHSRDSPDQQTGISFQNCSILATEDLRNSTTTVKSYLGRPWRPYSRTVIIESYIDDLIDPGGWIHWSEDEEGLDTLYYGEYANVGPGSNVDGRVTWPGYHIMDYYEAYNFSVSEFITGQEWLDSTSFPYDDGV